MKKVVIFTYSWLLLSPCYQSLEYNTSQLNTFSFICCTARLATTGKLIDGEDDDDNFFDDDWTWNSDRKPGLFLCYFQSAQSKPPIHGHPWDHFQVSSWERCLLTSGRLN